MIRSLRLAAIAIAISLPLTALALFTRPSDLLFSITDQSGKPRQFTISLFSKVENAGETIQLSGSVKGMGEGTSLKNAKLSLHTSISATIGSKGDASAGFDVLGYHDKLFVRLTNLTVNTTDFSADDRAKVTAFQNNYQGRWIAITYPKDQIDALQKNGWKEAVSAQVSSLTEEQIKDVVHQLIDAIFQMENTRYINGQSYTLTLQPNFAAKAMAVLSNAMRTNDPSLCPGCPPVTEADDSFTDIATMVEKALVVKVKVDTGNDDSFRFQKYFASITLPEAGLSAAFQGTVERRTTPVNIEIPTTFVKMEDVLKDLGMQDVLSSSSSSSEMTITSPEPPSQPTLPRARRSTRLSPATVSRDSVPFTRVSRRTLMQNMYDAGHPAQ
ncbi:MAG: hypothetical protein WCG83_01495 [Candidatus Peregrinibacteria bacterium]